MSSLKRVLIVDDNEMVRDTIKQIFTYKGYEIFEAGDSKGAFEIVQNNNIMVMFLDLSLPDEDGITLCERIRKDNPLSIIIAITGYTNTFEIKRARLAGFDDYLVKPLDINLILKILSEASEKIDRWFKF